MEQVKVVKAARFEDQKRADHARVRMKSAIAERDVAVEALHKIEAQLAHEQTERIELEAQYEATVSVRPVLILKRTVSVCQVYPPRAKTLRDSFTKSVTCCGKYLDPNGTRSKYFIRRVRGNEKIVSISAGWFSQIRWTSWCCSFFVDRNSKS